MLSTGIIKKQKKEESDSKVIISIPRLCHTCLKLHNRKHATVGPIIRFKLWNLMHVSYKSIFPGIFCDPGACSRIKYSLFSTIQS